MANAYATIATAASATGRSAITKVVLPDGTSTPLGKPQRKKVFTDGQTDEATRSDGGQRPARHRHARRSIGCPAAGKTGTTSNFTDAWFVGITPRLSTAVWVGYPNDASMTLVHAAIVRRHVPAPIWHDFMTGRQGQLLRRLARAEGAVRRAAVLRHATPRPARGRRPTTTTPRRRPTRRDRASPDDHDGDAHAGQDDVRPRRVRVPAATAPRPGRRRRRRPRRRQRQPAGRRPGRRAANAAAATPAPYRRVRSPRWRRKKRSSSRARSSRPCPTRCSASSSTTTTTCSATSRARCAASASASCRATACASSSRRTT